MKYQNKENGIIATVVEENAKYKTITLQFEDGNVRPYSISTIKRHWKLVQEEPTEEVKTEDDKYVEEVMQQKKDLGIECPPITEVQIVEESHLVPMPGIEKLAELKEDYCADGTSYAEVGKEIAKQAKQKAKAAKKAKKAPGLNFQFIAKVSLLASSLYTVTQQTNKDKNYLIFTPIGKKTGKLEVRVGNDSVHIRFKSKNLKKGFNLDVFEDVRHCNLANDMAVVIPAQDVENDKFTRLLEALA